MLHFDYKIENEVWKNHCPFTWNIIDEKANILK